MQALSDDSDREVGEETWPIVSRPSQGGRTASMRTSKEDSSHSAPIVPTMEAASCEPAPKRIQSPTAGPASGPSGLAGRPKPVTGTGAPSHLVGMPDDGDKQARATYVLEGISPEATDDQVRAMVSPVVRRLHDLKRLDRHAGARLQA